MAGCWNVSRNRFPEADFAPACLSMVRIFGLLVIHSESASPGYYPYYRWI